VKEEDMTNLEYGDNLIRLGNLMKDPNAKLADLVSASLDCGLIYTFGVIPDPKASIDMVCGGAVEG
jgi:hypothetical protein